MKLGQVSLANIIAMGVSAAKHRLLVGDQMQLVSTHPGRITQEGTGVSGLWITCIGGNWPPFRTRSRRLFLASDAASCTPTICRFISDAVYDSRLARPTIVLARPDSHSGSTAWIWIPAIDRPRRACGLSR